jgi:hypothetical protein
VLALTVLALTVLALTVLALGQGPRAMLAGW